MQTNHNQSFSKIELGAVMATANVARAQEMRRLFGLLRTAIASAFAPRLASKQA